MGYHRTGAGTRGFVVCDSLEYFLRDRIGSLAYFGEKVTGGPGRPSIHAAEPDPALICVGTECLHHFILTQKTHHSEVRTRSIAHIDFACDAIPIPGHLIGRRFVRVWRRGSWDQGQVPGRRPARQAITAADLSPGPISIDSNGCDDLIEFKETKRWEFCSGSFTDEKPARRYPILISRGRWRRRRGRRRDDLFEIS